MQKKSIAFLHPFSSTEYLTDTLRKYGINAVAIYTDNYFQRLVPIFNPTAKGFEDVIHFKTGDSKEELIQKLRELNTLTVWCGYELEIELCDELAYILSPELSNSKNTSSFRENKHETVKALQQAKLPYPKELLFKLSTISTNFAEFERFKYPAIIKPVVCSGAMNAFKYLNSYNELQYFLQHSGHKNHDEFILQEYLMDVGSTDKIEISYSIDSISYKGKHYIISVQRWHKLKTNNNPEHYYSEQLLPNDSYFKIFEKCVPNILDAVGLKNGFCHPEFYLTKDGPILIDLNPRLAGARGFLQQLMYECLGTCPVHRLGELLTQQPFKSNRNSPTYGYCIYYRTSNPKTLLQIAQLASYRSHEHYRDNLYLILITNSDKQLCKSDLEFILKRNEIA